MKEYQNYIFDLYGTLVDIYTNEGKASLWKNMSCIFSMLGAPYAPSELHRQYQRLVAEELAEAGREMRKRLDTQELEDEEIEILLENVFAKLLSEKGVLATPEQIGELGIVFRSLSMGYIRLFEGAKELLMRLKKAGKRVYLLSNAQRMFTEPEMRMLGIYDLFDGIFYSSDAGVKKPSLFFFDALFQKYDLKKEASVMVGNEYRADIQGAESYGIDSMYIFTAQSGEEPEQLPSGCRRLQKIGEVF